MYVRKPYNVCLSFFRLSVVLHRASCYISKFLQFFGQLSFAPCTFLLAIYHFAYPFLFRPSINSNESLDILCILVQLNQSRCILEPLETLHVFAVAWI